jgi:hypothetical protein
MRIQTRRQGLGDLDLSDPATIALAAITPTLTIQTSITPPMTIDLTGGGGGSSGGLVTFLKPTVTLNTPLGGVVIAPAGAASGITPDVGTWAMFAGLALAGLIGFGFWLGYSAK